MCIDNGVLGDLGEGAELNVTVNTHILLLSIYNVFESIHGLWFIITCYYFLPSYSKIVKSMHFVFIIITNVVITQKYSGAACLGLFTINGLIIMSNNKDNN